MYLFIMQQEWISLKHINKYIRLNVKKDTTNIQKHIHQIVYIYMYANYSARASRSMVLPTRTRQS